MTTRSTCPTRNVPGFYDIQTPRPPPVNDLPVADPQDTESRYLIHSRSDYLLQSPRGGGSSESEEDTQQPAQPGGGAVPFATPWIKQKARAKDGSGSAIETDGAWEFDLMNALPREKALALLKIIEQADRRQNKGVYNAEHCEGKLREMMATLQKTVNARQQRMMQEAKEMNDHLRVELFNMVKAGAESQRQAAAAFEKKMHAQVGASDSSLGRIEEVPEMDEDTSKGQACGTSEGGAGALAVRDQELRDLMTKCEWEVRSSSISMRLEAERTERSKEVTELTERMAACEEMVEIVKRLVLPAEQRVGKNRRGREQPAEKEESGLGVASLSCGLGAADNSCHTPRGTRSSEDRDLTPLQRSPSQDLFQALNKERGAREHLDVLAKLRDERAKHAMELEKLQEQHEKLARNACTSSVADMGDVEGVAAATDVQWVCA